MIITNCVIIAKFCYTFNTKYCNEKIIASEIAMIRWYRKPKSSQNLVLLSLQTGPQCTALKLAVIDVGLLQFI